MYKAILKPTFDYLFGMILLIGSIPVFLFIGLIYWILGESPLFFSQTRIGKGNRKFNLFKLRTLGKNDQTTFPFGAFLRRYYLDEIPQLWNVIKGELSFVGPRPLLEEYLPLYDRNQIKRHQIKPGITGWAQVNGGNNIPWEKKFELDLYYVKHVSFLLDLKIMIKTLEHCLSHKPNTIHYTEKFTGKK